MEPLGFQGGFFWWDRGGCASICGHMQVKAQQSLRSCSSFPLFLSQTSWGGFPTLVPEAGSIWDRAHGVGVGQDTLGQLTRNLCFLPLPKQPKFKLRGP